MPNEIVHNITAELEYLLWENGADIVGIGNLTELPEHVRYGFL